MLINPWRNSLIAAPLKDDTYVTIHKDKAGTKQQNYGRAQLSRSQSRRWPRDGRLRQFVSALSGEGILPPRAIMRWGEIRLTGMIGAWPSKPPKST